MSFGLYGCSSVTGIMRHCACIKSSRISASPFLLLIALGASNSNYVHRLPFRYWTRIRFPSQDTPPHPTSPRVERRLYLAWKANKRTWRLRNTNRKPDVFQSQFTHRPGVERKPVGRVLYAFCRQPRPLLVYIGRRAYVLFNLPFAVRRSPVGKGTYV